MRLIDKETTIYKCPVCGDGKVNESSQLVDICRQDLNKMSYCPVCGRFIGECGELVVRMDGRERREE